MISHRAKQLEGERERQTFLSLLLPLYQCPLNVPLLGNNKHYRAVLFGFTWLSWDEFSSNFKKAKRVAWKLSQLVGSLHSTGFGSMIITIIERNLSNFRKSSLLSKEQSSLVAASVVVIGNHNYNKSKRKRKRGRAKERDMRETFTTLICCL